MRLLNFKRGDLTEKTIGIAVTAIVLLVVLFQLYATLVPEAQAAGNSLGDAASCGNAGGFFNTSQTACLTNSSPTGTTISFSTIPLSGLFSGTGVVFVIILAALIVLVVRSFLTSKSS